MPVSQHAMKEEAKSILALSWPIMISSCLSFLLGTVDMAMVGHLGKAELAGAALGNLLFSCICYPILDVTTALDTLLSQCYGAGNHKAYGEWLITGLAVCLFATIPILVLLWYGETIFRLLQPEEYASLGGQFTRWLMLGIPPFFIETCLVVYMQCQHIVTPLVWIGVLSNILNIVINYVLIYCTELRFIGSPVATSITRWLQLLMTLGYLAKSRDHKHMWPQRFTWTALAPDRIKTFLTLGLFGVLALALEVWCFEASIGISGFIDLLSLDAQAVMMTVTNILFMSIQFPFGVGAQIRLGNVLGAGDAMQARLTARVSYGLIGLMMCGVSVSLLAFRNQLGYIFSSDDAVVALTAKTVPILAAHQLFDGLQAVTARLLIGMGKQPTVVVLNIIGFWCVGIPLALYFTFYLEWKLQGLWWGFLVGLVVTATPGILFVWRGVDWESEARKAVELAGSTTPAAPSSGNEQKFVELQETL